MNPEHQKIMLDYLEKAYPIKRIKDGGQRIRYKKAMLIYNQYYHFSTATEKERLAGALFDVLEMIFGFNRADINMVVLQYIK